MSGFRSFAKLAVLLGGTIAVSFCGGTQYSDRGSKISDAAAAAKKSSNASFTPEIYTNIPYVILSEIEQLLVILGSKFPDQTNKSAWSSAKIKVGTVDVSIDSSLSSRRELLLKPAGITEGTHDASIKLPGSSLTMSKAVVAVAERSDVAGNSIVSSDVSLTSESLALVTEKLSVSAAIRNELYYPFSLSASESIELTSSGKIEGPVDMLVPKGVVEIAGTVDLNLAGEGSASGGGSYDSGDTDQPHCEEAIADEIAKIETRADFLKFLHTRVANGSITLMRVVGETVTISGKVSGQQNMANNCHSTPVVYIQGEVSISGSIDLHNGLVYVFGAMDDASKERISVGEKGLLMVEADQ